MAFVKDPQAVLDYMYDFTQKLSAGDTITTHDVTVATGDVVKNTSSNTANTVTVWLSGGTVNTTSTVRFRITTAQGRTDDRTVKVHVKET